MDLKGYEIKNTTKCECGHEFVIKDMKKLQRIENDDKFYGGLVKHFDEIKCPVCGKDTMLFIKQQGQTYVVKDMAQRKEQNEVISKGQEEFVTKNEPIQNETDINVNNKETEANIKTNNDENNPSNEIICPVCKKAFKNNSGLSRHMLTHNN